MGFRNDLAQINCESFPDALSEEDLALKDIISPLGRLWMYASSLVRRYVAWRTVSRLSGPYVEKVRFWTGGRGPDIFLLDGRV